MIKFKVSKALCGNLQEGFLDLCEKANVKVKTQKYGYMIYRNNVMRLLEEIKQSDRINLPSLVFLRALAERFEKDENIKFDRMILFN